MLKFKLDRPGGELKLLCLGAHSDDLEIGCGGLLLSLLEQGQALDVNWIVLSGDGGRDEEARSSANILLKGVRRKRVTVEQFRDGFFPSDNGEIKAAFERLKRDVAPDVILTHYRYDRHQDHRVISDLTWNTFRDHCILEYEVPKYDGDLGRPNVFVPLDRATCARKVSHLERAFGSQRDKHWFSAETFLGLMRLRGVECRAPSGYAEAYYGRKVLLGGGRAPAGATRRGRSAPMRRR
jgi:LmbE family N-acetylglucosaminyl deacetylase